LERALKKAIMNRKNAMFYKTLNGAQVGGANPFDYLTELQRHAEELQDNPSEWMPWNYRDTLVRLARSAAA
jgi:transposase